MTADTRPDVEGLLERAANTLARYFGDPYGSVVFQGPDEESCDLIRDLAAALRTVATEEGAARRPMNEIDRAAKQMLRSRYISLLIDVLGKCEPFDSALADHIEELIERQREGDQR